jgi:hypothetical protein
MDPFAIPGVTPGAPVPAAPGPTTIAPTPNPGGETVWLKSSEGTPFLARTDQVGALLQNGYTGLEPEVAARLTAEQKHKGVLDALKAAGTGAVEMIAPVVGPAVMDVLGYPLAEQRERAEARPIAHGFGQVAGAVAPLVATLGTSAPAQGAALTARGALGTAAKYSAPAMFDAAGAAVGMGTKAAMGTGSLGRITAAAANQAAQGALYAGADWANRAVQGDPKATAEQLFAQGAAGAVFGGTLGAIGGTMTRIAGSHADDIVETLRSLEARGGLKSTGAIQGDFNRWIKSLGRNGEAKLEEIGRFIGREGGATPFQSFDDKLALSEKWKDEAWQVMKGQLDAAGAKKAYGFVDDIINDVKADPFIQKWAKDPFSRSTYNTFMEHLQFLENDYVIRNAQGVITAYKAITPEVLHDLSKMAAQQARGFAGSQDAQRKIITAAFDNVRYKINERLSNLMDSVGVSSKVFKEAKAKYQAALFLEEGAEKGWVRTKGNNVGSPTEILGAVAGAAQHGITGAAVTGTAVGIVRREGSALTNFAARHVADFLEKVQTQTGQKIADSIGNVFRSAGGVTSAIVGRKQAEYNLTRDNFSEKMAEVSRVAQDPEHAAERITTAYGPMIEEAGQVALSLQQTAVQNAQFLTRQMPTYQKQGLLEREYTPSHTELSVFNRAWAVAHDPTVVIDRIATGTFVPEDAHALQSMYPALFPLIKAQLADALASAVANKVAISPQARMGLSQFLGVTLSSNMTGPSIAQAQAVHAQSMQQAQPAPPPKNLNFKSSSQYATSTQASRERMDSGKA